MTTPIDLSSGRNNVTNEKRRVQVKSWHVFNRMAIAHLHTRYTHSYIIYNRTWNNRRGKQEQQRTILRKGIIKREWKGIITRNIKDR